MSKVKDLPEITTLDDNDWIYVVDDSVGTNGGRKIKKSNLKTTTDQSPAEIKTAYESNADTNAFTDAEQSKLAGIEAGATADQQSDEVPYDNNLSGLTATNAKAAFDELQSTKEPVFTKNSAFNKNFGSTAGTVVEGDDDRLSTVQKITVKKNPGPGQFSSIKAAIDSISDASSVKPYQINVGPGVYVEDTITVTSFIYVRGERNATVVQPSNPNNDIFILQSQTGVAQLKVEGATGVGASAFKRTGGTSSTVLNLIEFGDNYNLVTIDSTAGSPYVVVDGADIGTNVEFQNGFQITGTGTGVLFVTNVTALLSGAGVNPDNIIKGSGSTNDVHFSSSSVKIVSPASLINAILLEDGVEADIFGVSIDGPNDGLSIPNVGAGPNLNISNLNITNAVSSPVTIQNPNAVGFISGTWDFDSDTIDETPSSNLNIVINHSDDATKGFATYGDIYQGLSESQLLNISKLNREEATLGLTSGGVLSTNANPFDAVVGSGTGFVVDGGGNSVGVSWDNTIVTMTPDESAWITVNSNGTVQKEVSLPFNLEERVILGKYLVGDSQILGIDVSPVQSLHHGNKVERFLRNVFGALYASGHTLTENAVTDREMDLTAGQYFFGSKIFSPSGGTSISYNKVWRDGLGDFSTALGLTVVPNNEWDDNSGILQTVPAGRYCKHVLIGGGEGPYEGYSIVIANAHYATQQEAEDADLPVLPAEVSVSLVTIAAIVVQEGNANFVTVLDVRPRPAFGGSASGASTDHGGLSGLTDDDHTQYLLGNGTRAMTGDLNMGTHNITNVGTVDGVNVAAHASRHLPNGADPLTTAAPVTNLSGNTTNSVGNANSLARSNHTHAVDNATTSIAGFMSSTDKTKLDGIESGATADQAANEVVYDNAGSTLVATDVDAALDEADGKIESNSTTINAHLNGTAGKHDATEIDYERIDGSKKDIQAASDDAESAITDLDDNKLSKTGSIAMTGALDMGTNNINNIGTVDGRDVSVDGTKLDGIEAGATADAAAGVAPPDVAASGSAGTDTNTYANANHTHGHGNQAGGTLHSAATTSVNGFMSAADKTKLDGISLYDTHISADQFENPVTADWAVNALAPAVPDTNNSALISRLFDDTTEEGVGFSVFIPNGATNMTIRFLNRAETAPGAARTVGLKLYERGLVAGVDAWSAGITLNDVDIDADEQWNEDSQTDTLSNWGLTAGQVHQFELTRINPTAGTELTGDWVLQWLKLEFS